MTEISMDTIYLRRSLGSSLKVITAQFSAIQLPLGAQQEKILEYINIQD